jgi:hypothetical protein
VPGDTTDSSFATIELTGGEWKAAADLGDRYLLLLVASCCGENPNIQRLHNPACAVAAGQAQVVHVVYRFQLVAPAEA